MFDRKSIKEYARFRLSQRRWIPVIVLVLAGFMGASAASHLPSFNFSVSAPMDSLFSSEEDYTEGYTDDYYDYYDDGSGTVWDDALPGGSESADPDAADPGIWEDAGGESGLADSWEEFKSWFERPSMAWGMGIFLVVFLFVFLIVFAVALLETIFLGNIVTVGLRGWLLRFWRSEPVSIKELFDCFRIYKPTLKAMFVAQLYEWLWGLLFWIPGIIKRYAYAMVPYVIYENPNLTPNQAVTLSRKLTRGYKWKLFVLDLSFIGWELLNIVTFGIVGLLYVNPYKSLTHAGAYEQLKWAALQEGRATWQDFGQMPPAEVWEPVAEQPAAQPAEEWLDPSAISDPIPTETVDDIPNE